MYKEIWGNQYVTHIILLSILYKFKNATQYFVKVSYGYDKYKIRFLSLRCYKIIRSRKGRKEERERERKRFLVKRTKKLTQTALSIIH